MYVMMTSLKRGHLLPLAAFLFMSIVPMVTEVVNSMSDCGEFLLRGTPPRVPGILEDGSIVDPERYKAICQTHENQRRFVTLYDTQNRIPVFSAYKFKGKREGTHRPPWQIEPQYLRMTSLKRGHLLPLAAFPFMSIVPMVTELVNSMSDCDEFLLDGTLLMVPGILEDGSIVDPERYKIICQTHENLRRFVTLYDTQNGIPVFTAYKFRGIQNIEKTRRSRWRTNQQFLRMTSLKRGHLLPLAAFPFMSIVPMVTELVNSTSDCDEFLLDGTLPRVPGILEDGSIVDPERYKFTCQTYENQRRFVTLYDTQNGIPVFTAHKYRGGQNIENSSRPPWKIEPQLEIKDTRNMWDGMYRNQATDDDYKNNNRGYNRGHLFPNSYAFDLDEQTSTFTLTNIVPQVVSFNGGSWEKMETCTKCILEKYCINNNDEKEAFLVTGAQPSKDNKLNNRVNIPSMLWSAFCCFNKNKDEWLASAHWGANVEETKNKYLQTKTLAELQETLSTGNPGFEMFPGTQCPLHTTVAEFYPEVDKNCKCPPQASTTSAPPTTTTSVPTTTEPKLIPPPRRQRPSVNQFRKHLLIPRPRGQ